MFPLATMVVTITNREETPCYTPHCYCCYLNAGLLYALLAPNEYHLNVTPPTKVGCHLPDFSQGSPYGRGWR
jgi:hypothetical protein